MNLQNLKFHWALFLLFSKLSNICPVCLPANWFCLLIQSQHYEMTVSVYKVRHVFQSLQILWTIISYVILNYIYFGTCRDILLGQLNLASYFTQIRLHGHRETRNLTRHLVFTYFDTRGCLIQRQAEISVQWLTGLELIYQLKQWQQWWVTKRKGFWIEKLHYIVVLIAFHFIFCIVLKQQKITGQKRGHSPLDFSFQLSICLCCFEGILKEFNFFHHEQCHWLIVCLACLTLLPTNANVGRIMWIMEIFD